MGWKLVSYSEIMQPLSSFPRSIVGIIEDNSGNREIARINRKYSNYLEIGMQGKFSSTFFEPNIKLPKERKVALITGSSTGIGKATAVELAKAGVNIIINNKTDETEGKEALEKVKKMGTECIYLPADVSDAKQVNDLFQKILEKFGRLDILVNNAGITLDKRFDDMNEPEWKKVIDVNLTGAFNCTKHAINIMKKQGGGKIINIASVIGQIGNVGQANYAASKGGLIAFTKSIAKEYAKDCILVNAVAPGFINTGMTKNLPTGVVKGIINQTPLRRFGEPEEVAKLVAFLASDDSNYITGQVVNINGGLYV